MSEKKDTAMTVIFFSIVIGCWIIVYLLATRYPDFLVLLGRVLSFVGIALIVIAIIATIVWAIIILLSPDDEHETDKDGE